MTSQNSIPAKQDYQVIFPQVQSLPDQDQEWFILDFGDRLEKVRFHDYNRIFEIEGLYEKVFYDHLECKSPKVVSNLLMEVIEENGNDPEELRVLDFGAGNGMVGEQIINAGAELVVGVDILPEAKMATHRDRPDVYQDYHIVDMTDNKEIAEVGLEEIQLNSLVTVAALGFGDIPTEAFVNAFNLIENEGYVAFNIRDKFLSKEDDSGFKEIIQEIAQDSLEIAKTETYCHRLALNGEPLNYQAIVGRKVQDISM